MKVSCPACGADVQFKSKIAYFGVCTFCQSTLVRHDSSLENLGRMSEMPTDMSPLQVGTSGAFQGSRFEIVGRQKIGWSGGMWNEWYLYFDTGKDGWLADAQGFYAISFHERELKAPSKANIHVGLHLELKGISYCVDDMREVSCVGSQGELPVRGIQGRKSLSVDLVAEGGGFASIDYSTDDGERIFLGEYVEFEDLKMMNLRELEGW